MAVNLSQRNDYAQDAGPEVDGALALKIWKGYLKRNGWGPDSAGNGFSIPDGPGWGDVSHEEAALDWWRKMQGEEAAADRRYLLSPRR